MFCTSDLKKYSREYVVDVFEMKNGKFFCKSISDGLLWWRKSIKQPSMNEASMKSRANYENGTFGMEKNVENGSYATSSSCFDARILQKNNPTEERCFVVIFSYFRKV